MKVVRPPALTDQKYRTTRSITGGTLIDMSVISETCFRRWFTNREKKKPKMFFLS